MTKSIQSDVYYVYYYLRSVDSDIAKAGTPYYVGKGKGSRCTAKHKNVPVPHDDSRIVKVAYNLTNNQAKQMEILHIAIHGRIDLGTGILRNRTNGGDGCVELSQDIRKLLGHAKGHKWWNNGKISLQSVNRPGDGWTQGRTKTKRLIKALRRSQYAASIKVKGTTWWTNGSQSVRSVESPGPDWKPGSHNCVWNKGKQGHLFWWHNGLSYVQSYESPGPEWFRSSPLAKKPRNRPTGESNHKGTCWWTNGSSCKRSDNCPGEGWTRGTGLVTQGSKGMRWWNDGLKNTMSKESPGPRWVAGKL